MALPSKKVYVILSRQFGMIFLGQAIRRIGNALGKEDIEMKATRIVAAAAFVIGIGLVISGCGGGGGGSSSLSMRSGKVYYHQNKDYVKAEEWFRKAVAEDPQNWEAHFYLGLSQTMQGEFVEAGAAFEDAYDLAPPEKKTQVRDNQKVFFSEHFRAGLSAKDTNNLPEALLEFQKAVGVYPHDVSGHINLAYVYRELGQADKALEIMQQSVKVDSMSVYAWSNLGAAYHYAKQYDLAAGALQKVVDLKPKEADVLFAALYSLGNIYYEKKDYNKALEYYAQSAEIKADDPELQYQIGVTCLLLERYQEAELALQKCAALTETSDTEEGKTMYQDAMYNLSVAYIQMQNYDLAISTLQNLLARQETAEIHDALGRAYSRKGDKDKAVEEFRKAEAFKNK